jgi:hypothetical protein
MTRGGRNLYYRHEDIYSQCVACRVCYEKRLLTTPFEKQHLPIPWEGEVGEKVRVLFLLEHPTFTRLSPRLTRKMGDAELNAEMERGFEKNAIAFKRRRSGSVGFQRRVREVTGILLHSPLESIREYQTYVVSSMIRCDANVTSPEDLQAAAWHCTTRHAIPLLDRLPAVEWIVTVGEKALHLLLSEGVWNAFSIGLAGRIFPPPPGFKLKGGNIPVFPLSERIRCVALPAFHEREPAAAHSDRLRRALQIADAQTPGTQTRKYIPQIAAIPKSTRDDPSDSPARTASQVAPTGC